MKSNFFHRYSAGLTLVELLVSMLIASFIFAGVASVVSSSRESFVNEREASFIQENARYAVETISRDVRMAGSWGCALTTGPEFARAKVSNIVDEDHNGLFDQAAIMGYENGIPADLGTSVAGTDAVILRYGDPDTSVFTDDPIVSTAHSINTNTNEFNSGDKLIIVDASCRSVGIFENRVAANDMVSFQASGNNCDASELILSEGSCGSFSGETLSYQRGSSVMKYLANAYFIGESSVLPGVNALKRVVLTSSGTRTEELAQGVDDMDLQYGLDSDDNGELDRFMTADQVTAGNLWDSVIAVRFNMVFKSQAEFYSVAQNVTVNGVATTDRYLRQVASATVTMRNRKGLLLDALDGEDEDEGGEEDSDEDEDD